MTEDDCKKIARLLFELGDERDIKTTRIEFKGVFPGGNRERGQGGLCESALSKWLFKTIQPLQTAGEWITWQSAEAKYDFPCAFLATDGENVEKIYWDKPPMPGWVTHCMALPSPPESDK